MAKTFHFQLISCKDNENLTVNVGLNRHSLQVHTEESLRQAALTNRGLALLPEESLRTFSHYVEVPEGHLPDDRLIRISVTSPDVDPAIYLPALHHVSYHIPERSSRKYFERMYARRGDCHHPKLEALGVTQHHNKLSAAELIHANVETEYLLSYMDVAIAIISSNPELSSYQPYTASIVKHDHIAPLSSVNPTQYNQIHKLADAIQRQKEATSEGGWAKITDSVDQHGKSLYYECDYGTHKKGDRILIYKWSDLTIENAVAPNAGAMRSASNDIQLQNHTWSVNQGRVAIQQQAGTSNATLKKSDATVNLSERSQDPAYNWTVREVTPGHGLSVYPGTLKFKDNIFSIDVKNNYLRTLSAYAQFINDKGEPIQNPDGWNENLPASIRNWFETDEKKYIGLVRSVNTLFGIPMPTDPTTLLLHFPDNATGLNLMFGGLGTSKWDGDVDLSGALLTGLFQYGLPSLYLAAGAAITSSAWFNKFIEDKESVVAVLGVAFYIVGGGVATAAAVFNTKRVLFSFADAIGGILLAQGLEKLRSYVTVQITAAEVEDNIPYLGWALRAASMALNVSEMAVTTGEILSSPATLTVSLTRAMNLTFTLNPDPTHGEEGHTGTSVWPGKADHYQVTVQYEGGTNYVLKGRMPDTSSSEPIHLTFADVPVGGRLRIIAGVYSENGWLCGKYESDRLPAFPDSGSTTLLVSGNITEILVPLTQNTQYRYKAKVVFDASSKKHMWQPKGDIPTATVASLDCSTGGKQLCRPVAITLNGQAQQIGYVWSASNEKYRAQNLSVLSDPQSRFKESEVSFAVQPSIAYDVSGLEGADGVNNYIIDTRNNEHHLRRVNLEDGQSGFGLTDPNLKSWGKFNLSTLDAVDVHPSGAVIAVNWKDSKMEILQFPKEPVDDVHAPEAQMVSGYGVRQGLMQGPRAVAVAPDGRILILETLNQRIQAFDIQGNPVASFLGERLFALNAADYDTDLDKKVFSSMLQQKFQANGLTHIFDADVALLSDLNGGVMTTALIQAFADEGLYLSYDRDHAGDHSISAYVTVISPDQAWTVTDMMRNAAYEIKRAGSVLNVFDVLTDVTIDVLAQGSTWVVEDRLGAQSYIITRDAADSKLLNVNRYLPYLSLHNPDGRTDITYVDVAVEAKGYIYVLSYVAGGSVPSNYAMDIYEPNGSFLVRTPDSKLQPKDPQYICAAKFVIDMWRNVYTLNYEAMVDPNNRIEPSVSYWAATSPGTPDSSSV